MRVLLIGDDPADAKAVHDALDGARHGSFTVECVPRLVDGLQRLRGSNDIAAVLLDLSLPDSQGIATFEQVSLAAPHIPILIIGSPDDHDIATQAVRRGAQDYLHKTRLDSYSLERALRHAIERKVVEEALFMEQQQAQVTLNSIGDAVLSVDTSGNMIYLNPAAERMTGWSREEASGRALAEVFHIIDATTREPARNPIDAAAQIEGISNLTPNCLLVRRDGSETAIDSAAPIRALNEEVIGAVIVFHDVSAARELALQAIHLAQHDFLTNLPNRMMLNDRLTQAIALARRHSQHLAVLFLDLDQFKHVNDDLGHVIGDALLQSVAGRLVTCVRGSDTVSRQGGDEFVVLLSEIEHADDAAASAQRIIAALIAPHDIDHHLIHVSATIGISIYPEDGPDAETLIKCADTAMYHAKEGGRNNYRLFKGEMNARGVERQWIEDSLHRAIAEREFVLHYQPKVDLETGTLIGAEALIRWRHPERGLMLPNDFVAIAEDCGLIVPIGQWVVREACRQARAWLDQGRRPVSMAVNISAAEFRDAHFLDGVRTILDDTRLDARFLELELTESSLLQHAKSSTAALQALKKMGVQVAIDDFGTGASSLKHLRQFPIDALKLDHSFVHEITDHAVGAPMVRAVINMGRSLGHRVIAEGVETQAQLDYLRSERCAEGQGYYFSRPLAAEQFVKLLDTGMPQLVLH